MLDHAAGATGRTERPRIRVRSRVKRSVIETLPSRIYKGVRRRKVIREITHRGKI